MKKLLLYFGLITIVACSSITVSYDYDKSVDFKKYKSYAYTEEALKLNIGDLNRERLIKAIDSEMAARGMIKSDSPDALVDLIVNSHERVQATATNTGGYGRYGYAYGFSTTTVDYNTYVEGTLFINLIDKSTEKIVWQGRGTKTVDPNATPEKREANINNAVRSIFTKYPIQPSVKK